MWINLHHMLRPIAEGPSAGRFVWASERTGLRHLYLYEADGTLVRRPADAPPGTTLVTRVADGRITSTATDPGPDPQEPAAP